jgi:hypothetical protein
MPAAAHLKFRVAADTREARARVKKLRQEVRRADIALARLDESLLELERNAGEIGIAFKLEEKND